MVNRKICTASVIYFIKIIYVLNYHHYNRRQYFRILLLISPARLIMSPHLHAITRYEFDGYVEEADIGEDNTWLCKEFYFFFKVYNLISYSGYMQTLFFKSKLVY